MLEGGREGEERSTGLSCRRRAVAAPYAVRRVSFYARARSSSPKPRGQLWFELEVA